MYKLIALDMDGTLLKEDKTISSRTKKTLEKARERGVKVVLASGRPIEGLSKYLEELDLLSENDYVLSYNGALVQNVGNKEIVATNGLTGRDLDLLYNISKEIGVNIHAFSKSEGLITPKNNKYTELEATINGIKVMEKDFGLVGANEEIIKIMMIDEPEILEKAIEKLPKDLYEKYTIVRSAPYFLEFLNVDGNKGEGLKALSEHLGINEKEVIAMGDAGNDRHMIEYAGLGVAMGNAFPEIKEIANYVTMTNEEDGVAHVIEKFVLN